MMDRRSPPLPPKQRPASRGGRRGGVRKGAPAAVALASMMISACVLAAAAAAAEADMAVEFTCHSGAEKGSCSLSGHRRAETKSMDSFIDADRPQSSLSRRTRKRRVNGEIVSTSSCLA